MGIPKSTLMTMRPCQPRWRSRGAPGCLAQCESRGVCGALNHAISAYGGKGKKDKKAAERAACHHKSAIACLLDGKHRSKCRRLIGQAGRFGVPTTRNALHQQCR